MFKKRCRGCSKDFYALDLMNGLCADCFTDSARAADAETQAEANLTSRAESVILTTECCPGFAIKDRLGIVAAECCLGVNIFRDAFAGARDLFGGRTEAMQKALAEAREAAVAELKKEVARRGGNGAVGVRIGYEQISPGSGNMLLVTAIGTAVAI
ncbi:heavy metal-binding domain-containing protein [Paracoccus sphaerophysae]|uniref:heavy metal-binding domain-containing protein n=1 Tax=Paracoccus sphaerophysae TaxID=690417 RepID=UPI00235247C8|nr:heavy metal-binding domain-containing protein [Paracoccus sphaerophysae]